MPEENSSSEDDHVDNLAALRSQSTSPLAGRGKTLAKDIRVTVGAGPGHSASETEYEESDIAKTESDECLPASSRPWSTTAIPQNGPLPHLQQAPSPVFEKDVKAGRTQVRRSNKTSVSELAHDLGELNIVGGETRQPVDRHTRTRQSKTVLATEEDGDEDAIIVAQNTKGGEGQKKKKR